MRRIRFRSVLIGAALLALAGCGSGGGGNSQTTGVSTPGAGVTATTPIETAPTTVAPPTTSTPGQTGTSPEDQPGGAGDEVPISTQALFTGKGGDISPATVQVPPFIAVNVILHSADGASYAIEVAHHELKVDSSKPTTSVKLSGLRAGKRYQVDVTGAPETLSIVANAEPGP
ncbi:MAG TPA: hypothetical protein VGI67_19625 [Thermoleophilaceae bacterium]